MRVCARARACVRACVRACAEREARQGCHAPTASHAAHREDRPALTMWGGRLVGHRFARKDAWPSITADAKKAVAAIVACCLLLAALDTSIRSGNEALPKKTEDYSTVPKKMFR
eukprot:gene13794-biopygen11099